MASSRPIQVLVVAGTLVTGLAAPARAQMNTQHVKGSFGLKAGSQAPPGEYYIAPLLYFYSTDDIRNKNGDQMNLEGGVGGDFLQGGLTAGLSYYYCFKLTQDEPANFPLNIGLAKANVFALGPDITLTLASKKKGMIYGFVTVRYEWELHAEAQTKGGMWLIQAVLPFKPIHIPTP